MQGPRRRLLRSPVAAWLAGGTLLLVGACSIPQWPAEGAMASPFGIRWTGILPTVHRGVDISMPSGTPVLAMRGGNVRYAGWMTGFGNVIWLEHPRGTLSVYAHLSELRVSTGERVEHRQAIALSGATGNVTGPHLHFEVWVGGRPVDPVAYLGGRPR